MADLLALAFLKKLAESQNNPTLPGHLNALPGPAKQAIGLVPGLGALASPGGQLAQAATGGIVHQDQRAAQAIAGELALLAALAQVKGADAGVPGFDPQSTATASSRAALAQGFAHPGRAMEAIRTGPDTGMAWLGGGLEAASDPTNIIGLPARGATEASKAARVAATIYAAEHAQGLPIEALPRLIQTGTLAEKNAARLRLAALFEDATGKAGGVAGGVRVRELPKVAGAKQYLPHGPAPEPPPFQLGMPEDLLGGQGQMPLDLSGRPPLPPLANAAPPAAPDRATELLAAVGQETPPATPALETFGPESIHPGEDVTPSLLEKFANLRRHPIPGDQEIEDALGWSRSDISKLVSTAYNDVPKAIENARKARPDPIALTERAIERIRGDEGLVARLWERDPDLAQRAGIKQLAPAADEPVHAAQQLGGDIAAGGGGFGLLPFSGGLGAANRAVGGALAGGAVGGVTGALAEPDDRLGGAAKGAGVGALLGGNLGAGSLLKGPFMDKEATALQGAFNAAHPLIAHASEAGRTEQLAANAASTFSPLSALKNIGTVWKQQVTEHWKNILGDEAWGRIVLHGAQGKEGHALLGGLRRDMASRLKGATAWDREPVPVQDIQRAFGKEGVSPSLGESFHEAEGKLGTVISTSDRMIGGLGLSALNPAGIVTNAAGLLGSTALSGVRPWWHGFFQAFNGFQQATFRRAAYADEGGAMLKAGAEAFLPKLEAAGVDVSKLSPDGLFSAKDVHAIAGAKAAQEWQAIASMAEDAATRRVKFLFGDYGKRGGIEKLVGGPIPFTSWMIRAYPVALTMLAQHPAVALGVYHYMQATSAGAGKDGRPGFTAGMIPVDDKTLVLGALARLYTQGEGGKGYLDLLGGISPVGGDMFQPAEDDSDKNLYQKGTALLGRAGLPGPNPAIQAGAYITGLDFKAPGALSRTQGFENAAALIPGNPQLPNVGALLLRGARGAVSPRAEAAGIPGAKGDKTPSEYDPITRRYADLWIAKTGMALNDPRDPSGLVAMADPDNPLMQQARREVLLGGAVKNAASLTSPVGVIGQSAENKDYRAAKAQEPFSAARIAGSSPGVQRLMLAGNADFAGRNPAVNTYKVGNRETAAWALVDQFDQSARGQWLKRNAPQSYKQQKDELMIRVGLKEAPKQPAIR